jgi:EmrB/QacA subfamily drug resistance transporter
VAVIKKSKWWVLCGLAMGAAIIFMDSTILPVALPTIQKVCALSGVGLQWSINVYLLAIACFVLVGGRLADFFGHRKMFCLGMGLFGCFSILGGCAYTQTLLIISRAFQGISGALMLPSSVAILADTFPERERGRAIGLLVAIGSLFLSLGPVVGGLLAEYVSWRWVFWINVPIIVLGISIILCSIPQSVRLIERFDIPGCLVFIIALTLLILGLMQGREWGWNSVWVILLFALSALFCILLTYLLRQSKHPFFDYHLFKNTLFMGGNLLVFCTQFLLMISVYWVIYFQTALGYTPLQAGALMLVSTLPVMLGAPFSGYLADHFGPRIPVLIGFVLALIAFILWVTLSSALAALITALLLFGSGVALIMTPLGTMILGAVPAHKKGTGMGIYNTIRHTAAPLGVAVFGSIVSNVPFLALYEYGATNPSLQGVDIEYYAHLLAEEKPLIAFNIDQLSESTLLMLKKIFIESTHEALFWANLVCASVALLGVIVCLLYLWKPKKKLIHVNIIH